MSTTVEIGVGVSNFCIVLSCACYFLTVETLRCIRESCNEFVA